MKENSQQHYEGVVNHINNEKSTKIDALEKQLKDKDFQIYELKIKEGELIAKEKTIFNLKQEN